MIKNILVVNVNWVGDVIFSLPVFKALKEHYPQARIVCQCVPRVKPVAECCPYIDDVILYDDKGSHRPLSAKFNFVSQVRQQRFDIVFFLHGSWTRALLMCLAGIRIRVGVERKGRGRWLTYRVKPVKGLHRSDEYLHVIESFGVEVKDRCCTLSVSDSKQADAAEYLKAEGVTEKDILVVIHPGGNWHLKRWSKQNFAELVRSLPHVGHLKVLISGGSRESELAEEIAQMSGQEPIVTAGKTTFEQLVGLLHRADLLISNDSGPLHIANGVGTACIGIFGPTRAEITGPRGSGLLKVLQADIGCNRGPCYYLECPQNECMQAVSVADVAQAAKEMLWNVKKNEGSQKNKRH